MAVDAQPRTILPTFGPKRSVYNNSSSDIGGNLCVMDDSTKDYVKLPTSASVPIVGVTGPEGIKAKSWGSIINIAGAKVPIVNSGGVTLGTRLGVDGSAGKVVTIGSSSGTNYSLVGVCDQTGADGDIVEVTFAGPGAMIQAA